MSANHSRAVHIARFKGRMATHPADQENAQPGEVCIANIGTKERRLRLRFGVVAFAAGVLALVVLIAFHADPALRLLLFVPFAVGISSYFQWRDKT